MALKFALVLCLVSVFGCESLLIRPPYYGSGDPYRPFSHYRGLHNRPYEWRDCIDCVVSIESDESNEEYIQKEYGVASKPHATTYFVSIYNLSWENARDDCKARGMVLASPISQDQKWELEAYLQKNSLEPADQYSGYWIGGKRLSADEPWIWEVDGQEVKVPGWLPGEPNGYDGEDCIEFKYDYMSGWNNYYCSALKRFICQSKPHIQEGEKNNIKNPQFSHIHEEILKEKKYDADNKKPKDNIETSTAAATTTTNPYPIRFPFRVVHREHMPVFSTSRPWFYHTEGPSFSPETSSETSSTTINDQTENTELSTLENTAQTETSRATESTLKTNLISSTETTEDISSPPTTSERVSSSSSSVLPTVYLSSTERSINMDQSSPSSLDATVSTDIVMLDPRIRRYQELEEEFLHNDSMFSTYEDYL